MNVVNGLEDAKPDEQWSFVEKKENQRGLWFAIDHITISVLAYVFCKRKDNIFKWLKRLLKPFGIKRFYTDDWSPINVILTLKRILPVKQILKK